MARRAALFVVCLLPLTTAAGEPGRIVLFDGKSLDGWVVEGSAVFQDGAAKKPIWTVEEGTIRCAGKGAGFLRFGKRTFDDFVLHVEYRLAPKGNSGVGIRTVPFDVKRSKDTRPSFACYEIQLLDDAGKPATKHSTGSLYRHVAPRENPAKAAPEWNVMEIEAIGPRIRIRLNERDILDYDQTTQPKTSKLPLAGYISLQNHNTGVAFRNVWVRDLKKQPR